jgi:hypothetical protein
MREVRLLEILQKKRSSRTQIYFPALIQYKPLGKQHLTKVCTKDEDKTGCV